MTIIWLMFPQLDRGSIGWRMGSGEDYLAKWHKFYKHLNKKEKRAYQSKYPEPLGWEGFYSGTFPD